MVRTMRDCGESVTVADDISTAELARTISRLDAAVSGSLARIEGKLDRVTDDHERRLRVIERVDVDKLTADYNGQLKEIKSDYDDRLRALEKWMWGLSGTGAGTGLFALVLQLINQMQN